VLIKLKDQIINYYKKFMSSKMLGYALSTLSFVYPIFLIYLSWDEIKNIENIQITNILLVMGMYLASSIIQFFNWILILKANLKASSFDLKIYLQTLLMQRLPGGFWHWIGRVNLYNQDSNFKSQKAIEASVFERVALVLTGLSCFLIIWNLWLGILFVAIVLIIFYYWRKAQHTSIWRRLLYPFAHFSLYMICWLLAGLIFFVVMKSVNIENGLPIMQSISIWALTGSISLIFFFLPGGLGIKEISLTTLLLPYITFSQIMLLAVILRLVSLVMDLLISLTGLGLLKTQTQFNKDVL